MKPEIRDCIMPVTFTDRQGRDAPYKPACSCTGIEMFWKDAKIVRVLCCLNEKIYFRKGQNMSLLYPIIDVAKTGKRIEELRKSRGLKVRDIAGWMGFEEPQAVYKWQQGKSLPSLDNLFALSRLLGVSMDEIIVERADEKLIPDGEAIAA